MGRTRREVKQFSGRGLVVDIHNARSGDTRSLLSLKLCSCCRALTAQLGRAAWEFDIDIATCGTQLAPRSPSCAWWTSGSTGNTSEAQHWTEVDVEDERQRRAQEWARIPRWSQSSCFSSMECFPITSASCFRFRWNKKQPQSQFQMGDGDD